MFGRLRKSAEFERVRLVGKRRRGTYCMLNAARSTATANDALTRIGYITSKRIGNAVQRNRARRLMRAAMRVLETQVAAGWDIVLIAQPSLAQPSLKMSVLRQELEWLLKQTSILIPNKDNLSSKFSPDAALSDVP